MLKPHNQECQTCLATSFKGTPRPDWRHSCRLSSMDALLTSRYEHKCHFLIFSCPGSFIPDLAQWVTGSLGRCHFRILTRRVSFETWSPYDIWSNWCLTKTKRQKIIITKRPNDKKNDNNLSYLLPALKNILNESRKQVFQKICVFPYISRAKKEYAIDANFLYPLIP